MFKRFVEGKPLLLILFLCCMFNRAFTQGEINFTSLSTKNGLSSNTVSAIVKDRYGLMWFGTADGLNKFDGTNVTVYRHDAHDASSLPANEIICLFEDSSGRIWIGTNGGGVTYYDRKSNSFIRYKGDGSWRDIQTCIVRAFFEDHLGNLWVAAYDGLKKIDLKTGKITRQDLNFPDKSPFNQFVSSLFEDKQLRMWIGTTTGLYLLDPKTNHFQHFVHQQGDTISLSSNNIKSIAQDNDGNIWFGTVKGLNMLLPSGKNPRVIKGFKHNAYEQTDQYISAIAPAGQDQLYLGTEEGLVIFNVKTLKTVLLNPNKRNTFSLTSRAVTSILIDKDNICWIGTYRGGINKFDKNLALFNLVKSNAFDVNGLREPVVTSFAEYAAGKIFVGTDGGGLHLFDRKTNLFTHFDIKSKRDRAANLSILGLEFDNTGKLWVATFGNGLFQLDPATGRYEQYLAGTTPFDISQNDVFCVKQDSRGNIWIGTNGSGINIFNKQNQQFTRLTSNNNTLGNHLPINGYIRTITEDANGDMWLGSFGSGIAVYHPQSQKYDLYNKGNSDLADDGVMSILNDSQHRTWVGTNGGGLSLFDNQTHRFKTYTEKDGLANGFVYKILEDKNGMIWLSTDKGISSFDPRSAKFKNFGTTNGLQSGTFVLGSGLKTTDGELFFGGQDGFNYFQPVGLPVNKNIPHVIFTDLKVANNTVIPDKEAPINTHIGVAKEINLTYGQNFSISYVGIDYTAPQQNQYAYKLNGYDKDWNYVGTNTTAHYTNLDPGSYVFEVRASNNEGIWNKNGTIIKINVMPPLWRTTYAYFAYLLALTGGLLYIRRRGIHKIKKEFAIRQEKEQARQLLEQERREADRLHELDLLKIKFLTNLSHEFRTPISLILSPADQLQSVQRDNTAASQVQMIRRNAKRLLNLVNQLLDFRKMEEHELKLNLTQGDLITFVKDSVDAFHDLSERKKIQLEMHSSMKNLVTTFDHDKIERIIFNLLSNAFKFTHQGGKITLELNVKAKNEDGDQLLVLKISDTGVGIPPEHQAKIFERFFQHEGPDSILNQGSGIGLSITKEFVQMHGGDIFVDSIPGIGTTFTVILPIVIESAETILFVDKNDSADDETYSQNMQENISGSAEAIPVLIIEDNEDFRFYLKDNLKTEYRIIEAANGKEGWQKALSCHPQLIVSDINMPYMGGVELSRKLKSDKRTAHIPVILLTATIGEQAQIVGLQSGANDYLVKPFNFEILNAKIKNLLSLNRTFKDTYSKKLQVVGQEVKIESTDAKLLNTVVRYIEEKLNDADLSVEDLSKHVGMSRGSLYHKLLELTGLSPVEYIRSIKLERAAILLEKSDYNVAQIAYMTGFGTPSYFSRMFKAKFDQLPSEYLNMKRKDAKARLETTDNIQL